MRINKVLYLFASVSIALMAAEPPQITTSQYDNARSGANLQETILSPKNVNVREFGKVWTIPVDGDVYAQPLYLPKVNIRGKGIHNVLFVATEHDSVYAFDADRNSPVPLCTAITAVPSNSANKCARTRLFFQLENMRGPFPNPMFRALLSVRKLESRQLP
jgi:hypothetical protein